jgi:Tfp pilus assembly protein PilV
MIAMGMLLIGAIGALSLFNYSLKATATSKHITAATNIARAKLEEIKSTPFEDIITLYPNDSSSRVEDDFPTESTLLRKLPDEEAMCTVSYPDGTMANPLNASVVVSWQENGGSRQVELMTLVTSP